MARQEEEIMNGTINEQGGDNAEVLPQDEQMMDLEEKRKMDAKRRYDEDIEKHLSDLVKAERPQDDWQVAFIWAFIVRFSLCSRIPGLETLEDLEKSLHEPVASRPDDVLESVLVCFLSNLKPGNRNLNAENIQHHLSSYITDQLISNSEWTVWDRPWPLNEENRASCCTNDPFRSELGRLRYYGEPTWDRAKKNPLKRMEEKGGGLFELDWRERVRLLRQLVDWQLTYSELIRNIINSSQKSVPKPKKGSSSKNVTKEEETSSIIVEPLGQSRNRQRIWALDDSWRLYRSGNPFKRPCPLESISLSKDDYFQYLNEIEIYGAQSQEPPSGNGGTKSGAQWKRWLKGVQDEKKLSESLRERVDRVEKEEARAQRVKRKIAQAMQLQQAAELRSTRTRRPNRKIDYSYGDSDMDEDRTDIAQAPARKSRRTGRGGEEYVELDAKGRLVIPSERRSTRVSARRGSIGLMPGPGLAEVEHVGDVVEDSEHSVVLRSTPLMENGNDKLEASQDSDFVATEQVEDEESHEEAMIIYEE
nr:hypothetical protein L203_04947 [Cryptococcus depauperatus CBS 7841]